MYVFFADDSSQSHPSRAGMGELIASGGLFADGEQLGSLERSIGFICRQFGFPRGEEFKWSPRQNSWMYTHLVGQDRKDFFLWVIRTCADHAVKVTVIISDVTSHEPLSCRSHSEFVSKMLIERVDWLARHQRAPAIVVADRPGGARGEERRFLNQCLETIQNGTDYVVPKNIAFNTLSTDSRLVRLLQAADLVVGCTTSFVAGETVYSPPVFDAIRPLLASDMGRIGGVGLKLHPDFWYVNLYHWLLGDRDYIRHMQGWPLPRADRLYSTGPTAP